MHRERWARWEMFELALTVPAVEQYLHVRSREARSAEEIVWMIDFERLLLYLDDEVRAIALLAGEGCTQAEIASKLECSVRTVARRMGEQGLRTLPHSVGVGRPRKGVTL